MVCLDRCPDGVSVVAGKTREVALRKTLESTDRLCPRHLETESVKQLGARDPQDDASTSCLNGVYQKPIPFFSVMHQDNTRLTIVALGNAVLYSSALGKIRYLGPILVWVRTASKLGRR